MRETVGVTDKNVGLSTSLVSASFSIFSFPH